jgi:hypothetical protein
MSDVLDQIQSIRADWQDLARSWKAVREQWKDQIGLRFEYECWQPLENDIQVAMDGLEVNTEQIDIIVNKL